MSFQQMGATPWRQMNRVVFPATLDGGVLTALRFVGSYTIWTSCHVNDQSTMNDFAWSLGIDGGTIWESGLQLVPIRGSALDQSRWLADGIDMESNDWIARHTHDHDAIVRQRAVNQSGDFGNRLLVGHTWHIDIRSKRKFDTSQWALVWSAGLCVADADQAAVLDQVYFDVLRLRALFLTGPGN